MRIAMIGTGYVGLVSGACFSEFGVTVACVDKDAAKIDQLKQGRMPIFEPGLDALVANNVRAGRLSFTTDLAAAVADSDAVFIAVGTPSRRGDGHADLTYVYAAAREIARALKRYTVVVTKSTVPVGTGRAVARIITEERPDAAFDVVSNPEFLREGAAIGDFMRPDRVVIGADGDRAREVMRALYRPLYLIETPIVFTGLETAELIKYAANGFLAAKITFINEIADLCEKVGADVHDVARGIGLDGRIGRKFLHPGPGYGGSCFPKDTMALAKIAQDAGAPVKLIETTVQVNAARKQAMAGRVIAACGGSVKGLTVAVLGVTFKPNTDDMRESPSLDPRLRSRGHGRGEKAAQGRRVVRQRLRRDDRGRLPGGADGMEPVPRARRPAHAPASQAPADRRSAQRLQPAGHGGVGLRVSRHRPAPRGAGRGVKRPCRAAARPRRAPGRGCSSTAHCSIPTSNGASSAGR
jgi:UDPglucose 6-dehydrogenase